jgi:DNA-binding IclR family transcriptional regulator
MLYVSEMQPGRCYSGPCEHRAATDAEILQHPAVVEALARAREEGATEALRDVARQLREVAALHAKLGGAFGAAIYVAMISAAADIELSLPRPAHEEHA